MITTKAAAKMETYGRGGTYNRGRKYDETQCVHAVWSGYQHHQCTRKPGHGPDELYCKQHDPVAKAAKYKAERDAEERKRTMRANQVQRAEDIADAKDDCVDALKRVSCPWSGLDAERTGFDTCEDCHCPRAPLKVLDNAIKREV